MCVTRGRRGSGPGSRPFVPVEKARRSLKKAAFKGSKSASHTGTVTWSGTAPTP